MLVDEETYEKGVKIRHGRMISEFKVYYCFKKSFQKQNQNLEVQLKRSKYKTEKLFFEYRRFKEVEVSLQFYGKTWIIQKWVIQWKKNRKRFHKLYKINAPERKAKYNR